MKVLLALDPSPDAWSALEDTVARPWPKGSSFEVVTVVEASHLWTTSEVAEEEAARARALTQRAVARLQEGGHEVSQAVLCGDARRLILDRAVTIEADFIVLGSRGHVADSILRHAPCSVAILRQSAQMKILLATDGSEFAAAAAQSIADRPWPEGAEVRVLSVVQLVLPAAEAFFELPFIDHKTMENARAEAMKRALDAVEDAKRILADSGLPVSDSVSILYEGPREVILQEAAAWGADLIVLGSHGHSSADILLLGSVSEGVATHAACSVEVIRVRAARKYKVPGHSAGT